MPSRQSLVVTLVSLLLLCAGWSGSARAQSGSKTKSKQQIEKELTKLRNDIQAYEKKLKESTKKESSTLENIDNLERQVTLKRKLIGKLREQEESLTGDIEDARSSIKDLEQQVESLKDQYAKYVRSVYKYGRVYDVELLFSSKSINQLYIRMEYLKRFSEQRARDLDQVTRKKSDLEAQNEQLQVNLQHERNLLAEKTNEESSLKQKMSQRQKMLAAIRKDKHYYQQAKERGLKEIEKLIAELDRIEKERIRKEREAAAAREREGKAVPLPEPTFAGAFASHKGKLRWPVSSGTIASRFGNQVHPVLKTVRENTGIDIGVNPGSDVLAVADGKVSIVTFIPGFGNIVILNHNNGYRTVYAHLSEINVAEDQSVKAGEVIAKSGDSVDGAVLHFEIWEGTKKQNPEIWLAKQR
jgi:septal ring factor EnvC (AmiA/AmiB activator)